MYQVDDRLKYFLQELRTLSNDFKIAIDGCGCCSSPSLRDIRGHKITKYGVSEPFHKEDMAGNLEPHIVAEDD
jgi:hypothetical protein